MTKKKLTEMEKCGGSTITLQPENGLTFTIQDIAPVLLDIAEFDKYYMMLRGKKQRDRQKRQRNARTQD